MRRPIGPGGRVFGRSDAASSFNDSYENCMKEVSNAVESRYARGILLGSSPVMASNEHASSDGSTYHMHLQQATVVN
jgi:hypothetical protein